MVVNQWDLLLDKMKKRIILISGFIGSGKDTAAYYLVKRHKFVKLSFASSLKDSLSNIFGWDRELLEGVTIESRVWRETVDEWWANKLNIPNFTPRYAMQHIGTQVMREHFSNNIWVASLENKIRKETNSVVVTDCRFKNEFDSIKNLGGISIRIERNAEPEWVKLARSDFSKFKEVYPEIHPSEYSSIDFEYDHTINNNGDLADLHAQLRYIIR